MLCFFDFVFYMIASKDYTPINHDLRFTSYCFVLHKYKVVKFDSKKSDLIGSLSLSIVWGGLGL